MLVKVTQGYINSGSRGSRCGCPVALALKESTGREWLVDDDVIVDKNNGTSFPTPESVKLFLYGFDAGNEQEPFDFEIWEYD